MLVPHVCWDGWRSGGGELGRWAAAVELLLGLVLPVWASLLLLLAVRQSVWQSVHRRSVLPLGAQQPLSDVCMASVLLTSRRSMPASTFPPLSLGRYSCRMVSDAALCTPHADHAAWHGDRWWVHR
jgi:hypothetical protein